MTLYQDRQRKLSRSAVLTEKDVLVIKQRLAHYQHSSQIDAPHARRDWPRDIARDYGVSTETIRRIDRGDTWGWLTPEQPTAPEAEERMKARAAESLKALEGILAKEKL